MVQKFFETGFLLKELNHTNIVLIPKQDNPSLITYFRPISLCNVAYKIISKIMTSRLKPLMSRLISPAQNAFVPHRHIQENSILVHELMHTLKRKQGRGGLMAIKIDLEKAYDKVDRGFLDEVLRCFGFSQKWRQLVRQCVSTVFFSVLINGSPFGFFHPSRVLGQGDPLSRFLFILVMEALSRLVACAEHAGNFHSIKIARVAPPISHLLFADDLTFFCRATTREAPTLRDVLNTFERWTGQTINLSKSFLSFSRKMDPNLSTRICSIL